MQRKRAGKEKASMSLFNKKIAHLPQIDVPMASATRIKNPINNIPSVGQKVKLNGAFELRFALDKDIKDGTKSGWIRREKHTVSDGVM